MSSLVIIAPNVVRHYLNYRYAVTCHGDFSVKFFYLYLESKKLKVVVIGAGMAGLAAARQLQSFGVSVVVIEARVCNIVSDIIQPFCRIRCTTDTQWLLWFRIELGEGWLRSGKDHILLILARWS